jgi:hypothetical protein
MRLKDLKPLRYVNKDWQNMIIFTKKQDIRRRHKSLKLGDRVVVSDVKFRTIYSDIDCYEILSKSEKSEDAFVSSFSSHLGGIMDWEKLKILRWRERYQQYAPMLQSSSFLERFSKPVAIEITHMHPGTNGKLFFRGRMDLNYSIPEYQEIEPLLENICWGLVRRKLVHDHIQKFGNEIWGTIQRNTQHTYLRPRRFLSSYWILYDTAKTLLSENRAKSEFTEFHKTYTFDFTPWEKILDKLCNRDL